MAKSIDVSIDSLLKGTAYDGKDLTVGVAISGGRDSVALLHYLFNQGVKVVAINVEHGIRAEESVRDSEFVASFCNSLGVKLYAYNVDVPTFARENGYTLEQAGRILRYRIFDKLLDDGECDLIALAHHLDDQIETVFMRILRGTGVRGLAGMKTLSGRYLRPFLKYSREDINEYVKSKGLQFVEDSTNKDTAYTRNFLRGEISRLKERFPSMGEAVLRLAASAAEADNFIESWVPCVSENAGQVAINISDCDNILLAKRLILKAANALGVQQDIEDKHYTAVLDLINAQSGKYVMLTHGLCVHKQGENLVFERNFESLKIEERKFAQGVLDDLGVCIRNVDLFAEKINLKAVETLYIDADKIPDSAVIRGRLDGDYIHKFGGGTKSLGDYLTDKKVPLRKRDSLKLVADGSRVLAVFGLDISADVKVDESTKRVYALSEMKE